MRQDDAPCIPFTGQGALWRALSWVKCLSVSATGMQRRAALPVGLQQPPSRTNNAVLLISWRLPAVQLWRAILRWYESPFEAELR